MLQTICFYLCFIIVQLIIVNAQAASDAPFKISKNLYQTDVFDTLGLDYPDKLEHLSVFTAEKNVAQYNHGAVLFAFKGRLYAQWQSSIKDEDATDTRVLYSVSSEGENWSKPITLAASNADSLITNGGWWSDGKTLVSYFNVWPYQRKPKGGYVEYKTSEDGVHWSAAKRLRLQNNQVVEGVIEQDLKFTDNKTILTALHTHPGLVAKPFYTKDPLGISGWKVADMQNLPYGNKKTTSREIEPSWFMREDQQIIMVFRDQASSFKILASTSKDRGETWSVPSMTNMPDARAKLSAGNLPNGWAYIVNCPSGSKQRMPLVLTLSKNGQFFDQAFLLGAKSEVGKVKFDGKYKRVGFSYPKSIVWKDALWVSFAKNKEDIIITKVPLTSLYQFD
ncbi:MAG: exo-alpha-sialidase [Colwellia sp.]